jgi:hypothetical protein
MSAVTGCVRPGGTSCLLLTQDRRQGPRSGDDLHPFFSGGWAAGGHYLPILPSPERRGVPWCERLCELFCEPLCVPPSERSCERSCEQRGLSLKQTRNARRGHALRPTDSEARMDSGLSQQIRVCSISPPCFAWIDSITGMCRPVRTPTGGTIGPAAPSAVWTNPRPFGSPRARPHSNPRARANSENRICDRWRRARRTQNGPSMDALGGHRGRPTRTLNFQVSDFAGAGPQTPAKHTNIEPGRYDESGFRTR